MKLEGAGVTDGEIISMGSLSSHLSKFNSDWVVIDLLDKIIIDEKTYGPRFFYSCPRFHYSCQNYDEDTLEEILEQCYDEKLEVFLLWCIQDKEPSVFNEIMEKINKRIYRILKSTTEKTWLIDVDYERFFVSCVFDEHCISISTTTEEFSLSPLLNYPNLKRLSISGNFYELDLSPIRFCPHLEHFELTSSSMEKLDLSPLTHCLRLEELHLHSNCLKELDLNPLTNNERLQLLRLEKNFWLKCVDLSPLLKLKKLEVTLDNDTKLLPEELNVIVIEHRHLSMSKVIRMRYVKPYLLRL